MTKEHPSSDMVVETPARSVMRVSSYDKTASMLIAFLLLVGLTTLSLFIVWLTTVVVFVRVATPVVAYPAGTTHDPGIARDPESPGIEELPVTTDPPQVEALLQPVTNLASNIAASDDPFVMNADLRTGGWRQRGDDRPPGDGTSDIIPPWQRWEIRYAAQDINVYARQLDYFGIELAAAGGGKFVDYAFNLSRATPSIRQGRSKDEQRIYLTWKPGSQLRAFDETLLGRGEIKTRGRIVLQLLPDSLCEQLLRLEAENAQDRPPQEWLKTIFGVRARGSEFEFFIIEQVFRPFPAQRRAADVSQSLRRILEKSMPAPADFDDPML